MVSCVKCVKLLSADKDGGPSRRTSSNSRHCRLGSVAVATRRSFGGEIVRRNTRCVAESIAGRASARLSRFIRRHSGPLRHTSRIWIVLLCC